MTDSKALVVDVAALATLARLKVTPEEVAKLEKELPDILGFVATIQEASADAPQVNSTVRNVMREDDGVTESGVNTEVILNVAPNREGNYFTVPQVIKR